MKRHAALLLFFALLLTLPAATQITFRKYILSSALNFTRGALHLPSGGYIVGADASSLIRLDENGQIVWGNQTITPNGYLFATDHLALSSDSMFLLGGHAINFSQFMLPHELMAAKYDTSGNLLWLSIVDSTNQGGIVRALPVSDGGMILCASENISGVVVISLSRFSSTGQLLWHKLPRIPNYGINYFCDARPSGDGNYIASCRFDTLAWLFKFDPSGNILWSKKNNSMPNFLYSPVQVAMTAHGMATCDKLNSLFFFDSAGNAVTEKQYFNGSGDITIENLLSTSDGGLLAGGRLIINGNRHDNTSTASNDSIMLILKTDSVGNVQWARTWDTSNFFIRDLVEAPDGYLIDRDVVFSHHQVFLIKTDLQGHAFCGESDIAVVAQTIPGLASQSVTATAPNGNMNLVQLVCTVQARAYTDSVRCENLTGIRETTVAQSWNVSPNPSVGIFTLRGTFINPHPIAQVFDARGHCCLTLRPEKETTIDLHAYPPGLYLLRIVYDGKTHTERLIKN